MLSYCAGLVKRHSPDYFLQSLFVPQAQRDALMAVYALNAELAQVREKTSEELIAQVRLAWWQEAVEAIYVGEPPREQPVLQALTGIIAGGHLPRGALMTLMESYRAHFPDAPPCVDTTLHDLALAVLRARSPQAEPGWRKAQGIIAKHRSHYGQRHNGWLNIKLLIAGM